MSEKKRDHIKHSVKQTFAKSLDGTIRHISEVSNGLACDCVCSLCGYKLQARKGKVKAHHFAHHTGSDCAGATETALHLAAKEILLKEKKFNLPALPVKCESVDKSGYEYFARRTEKLCRSRYIQIDDITLEQRIGRIIPDIVAHVGNKVLLIEIAVTHFVDEEKKQKIASENLATIEIDLAKIDREIDWALLKHVIIDSTTCKEWIHNPRLAEYQALADEEIQSKVDYANKQIAAEEEREAQRKEQWKQERWNSPEHKQKVEWITNYLAEDNLKDLLANYAEKARKSNIITAAQWALKLTFDELPEFLNVQVKGELAFPCDRRVWQAAIFLTFFHPGGSMARRKGWKSVSVDTVVDWCAVQLGLSCNLFFLEEDLEQLTDRQRELFPNPGKAVLEYLQALARFGFTTDLGKQRFKIDRDLLQTKILEIQSSKVKKG